MRERYCASSCPLGQYLYVFGGLDAQNQIYNSFERINAIKVTSATSSSACSPATRYWDLIEFSNFNISPRCNALMAPIGPDEILILSGHGEYTQIEAGYVVKVR